MRNRSRSLSMGGGRRVFIGVVLGISLVLTFGFGQKAFAQNVPAQDVKSSCDCWINAKTGKKVPGSQILPEGAKFDDPEHNHASIVQPPSPTFGPGGTLSNFVRRPDNVWINSKTGKPVACSQLLPEGALFDDPEHNHASIVQPPSPTFGPGGTLSNFVRVPCPPPPKPVEPGPAPAPDPTPRPTNPGTSQIKGRTDIFIGYAYTFTPGQSVSNLNGIDASISVPIKKHVGVFADVGLSGGQTLIQSTFGTINTGTTRFAPIVFGFKFYNNDDVAIRAGAGVAHETNKTDIGTTTVRSSDTALALFFSANWDVRLRNHLAFRVVQFDYIPTHFGDDWQSNFRLSTGLVFRLGGK